MLILIFDLKSNERHNSRGLISAKYTTLSRARALNTKDCYSRYFHLYFGQQTVLTFTHNRSVYEFT